MSTLADDDVGLFIFDLIKEFGELFHCESHVLLVVSKPLRKAEPSPTQVEILAPPL